MRELAYSARLEIVCTRKRTEGSNPSLSAIYYHVNSHHTRILSQKFLYQCSGCVLRLLIFGAGPAASCAY